MSLFLDFPPVSCILRERKRESRLLNIKTVSNTAPLLKYWSENVRNCSAHLSPPLLTPQVSRRGLEPGQSEHDSRGAETRTRTERTGPQVTITSHSVSGTTHLPTQSKWQRYVLFEHLVAEQYELWGYNSSNIFQISIFNWLSVFAHGTGSISGPSSPNNNSISLGPCVMFSQISQT